MTALHIATTCYQDKVINSSEVFTNIILYEQILFWSRESTHERLSKHTKYHDLSFIIDDIASIVDSNMLKNRIKMLENGRNGKNSLFLKLKNVDETIKWVASRWGNVFMNFATNKNYKDYVDIKKLKLTICNQKEYEEDILSEIIQQEEQYNQINQSQQDLLNMLNNKQIYYAQTKSNMTQTICII